jgi:hypothetical protein
MDKFDSFYDDIPVCRFGPGGDFVEDWPSQASSKQTDSIAEILKVLAKMLDITITTKLLQNSTIDKINLAINNADSSNLTVNKEGTLDTQKPTEPDAAAVGSAEAHRKLSEKQMLFDNASGTGGIAGHKQNHGVRTHRRVKRKRTPFSTFRQGSLFEPYYESSKVA